MFFFLQTKQGLVRVLRRYLAIPVPVSVSDSSGSCLLSTLMPKALVCTDDLRRIVVPFFIESHPVVSSSCWHRLISKNQRRICVFTLKKTCDKSCGGYGVWRPLLVCLPPHRVHSCRARPCRMNRTNLTKRIWYHGPFSQRKYSSAGN
jgi:hypothetical protein